MIDPFMLRKRPDQTSMELNDMLAKLRSMEKSIKVMSEDKKTLIVIGNQPINPSTGRPYSFGIHTYRIKGDRLEEI